MKSAYSALGFALGASAAVVFPRDQCCFGLTASGGVSGDVGQLVDGQNRIAQTAGLDQQNGQYCINNGEVTDGNGRGCILTPPTTQFQCDSGASPTGGFSVDNGNLAHDGNTQFYACPTGDNGGYNIYTEPVENQQGCVTVTLSTGGKCSSSSSSASASASSVPASSAPASSAPASSAATSSAPASSAPTSSAAVSSAPPPVTQTIYSTHYETITSCGPTVSSCPAESTVVSSSIYSSLTSSAPVVSTPASSAPASSAAESSAPASSAPASASSASASSAPASSAPASSAPASSSSASSSPASSAPASSAPATSAPAQSSAAPSSTAPSSTTGSACATTLNYGSSEQTPHAIIPVNKNSPDQSYGTQYNAYIGGGNSTIFNFDIPQDYSGKQCSVIFLFPKKEDLETSDFTETGSEGTLTFSELSSAAGLDVTYNSAPSVQSQLAQISNVAPGNSYVVSTGACAAGTTESIEVSSSGDYELSFFEDWNPSPLGVFITSC